jgi:hypothetical protein
MYLQLTKKRMELYTLLQILICSLRGIQNLLTATKIMPTENLGPLLAGIRVCTFLNMWYLHLPAVFPLCCSISFEIDIVFFIVYKYIFSSPELKAQVSYSGCPSSACPSVCLSVCPSVRPSVCKLLHFRLLLQNHWTNFNQTWHRSFLGEGDSSLFKGRW